MTKIVLVPIHYANLSGSDSLKSIIEHYNPGAIGVEETQKDIDTLLEKSRNPHYLLEILDGLYKESLFNDRETTIHLAKEETDHYRILRICKNRDIKIIGCDKDDFPNSLYEGAIEEYSNSKKQFLKEILELPLDAAKEKIAELYNNILSISSTEELLHNEFSLARISEQVREYYKRRDEDTANRIRELAKEIHEEYEKRKNTATPADELTNKNDDTILYMFNVTHLNPAYPHIEFLLKDLEPEIVSIYGSENLWLPKP